MFRRLLSAWALAFPGLLAACASPPEAVAERRETISGGVESGAEEDAVVQIRTSRFLCSGVLVAPRLVLTSQHCVSASSVGTSFTCGADGELDNDGSGAGEIGENQPPAEIGVHVGPLVDYEPEALGEQVLGTGTTVICRDDLAFVLLDRSLAAVEPLPLRLDAAVAIGEVTKLIGYGASESDAGLVQRRRREGVRVVDADVPPRTLTTDAGPCTGDSGGPALSAETGAVLGVLSLVIGTCGAESSRGVYTRLAPFKRLALQAFELAGAEPWLEGAPAPGMSPELSAQPSTGCQILGTPQRCQSWGVLGAAIVWSALRCRSALRRGRRKVPTREPRQSVGINLA
jgi:V8-like Glu-specific endopeptidase